MLNSRPRFMVLAYDSGDMPNNRKDIMGYAENAEQVEKLIHTAKNHALYAYDHIETHDNHKDRSLTIRRNKGGEWHS